MNKFFYFLFFAIFISWTLASSDVYAATENHRGGSLSERDNHFAGPMIIDSCNKRHLLTSIHDEPNSLHSKICRIIRVYFFSLSNN